MKEYSMVTHQPQKLGSIKLAGLSKESGACICGDYQCA